MPKAKKTQKNQEEFSFPEKKETLSEPSSLQDQKDQIKIHELHLPITEKKNLIIYTWNVNGLRAISNKTFFSWLEEKDPDIVCLQETKSHFSQILQHPTAKKIFDYPYHSYWMSAKKMGYSGVATLTKIKPLKVQFGFEEDHPEKKFNEEGRVVITEFQDFILWNVYFPNGQRGPERVQYKLNFYEYCLHIWERQRKEKYLIITGDFNTAHKEIDLARPKENENVSGFLPEERAFLDKLISMGYVDVFRKFDPSPGRYTYWDPITRARERNIGWRIDYFFATEESLSMIKNCWIESEILGSDHCPVGLEIQL
ncbi:MAG: exodeoxyribonuclease III [Leptospiraceae bacterium]|nr:exodeoxyribonuclease III [Leptospiraceae bacterium]MDW7975271.1 exodeoxyribonuclease III [Leptospiraceae bacterium]